MNKSKAWAAVIYRVHCPAPTHPPAALMCSRPRAELFMRCVAHTASCSGQTAAAYSESILRQRPGARHSDERVLGNRWKDQGLERLRKGRILSWDELLMLL